MGLLTTVLGAMDETGASSLAMNPQVEHGSSIASVLSPGRRSLVCKVGLSGLSNPGRPAYTHRKT